MALTYEPIATQTADGTSAYITFNSVPQTYTDLILICQARSGTSGTYTDIYMRLATGGGAIDSGTNYSTTRLYGNGSSVTSDKITSSSLIYGVPIPATSATAGNLATCIFQIENYTNSSINKTIICKGGDAGGYAAANVGLWRNTGAITSVQLLTNSNFTSGNTFTLYGIKAA